MSISKHLHDSVGARAGILGMPNGAFLYADELLGALANKSAANGFKDMVLYIEACESGSIFEARLCSRLCHVVFCRLCHVEFCCALVTALTCSCAWHPAEAACQHRKYIQRFFFS